MLEAGYFLGAALVFGTIQFLLLKTAARNTVIKLLPIIVSALGLLFCLLIAVGLFGTGSPSVAAENHAFARFFCIPAAGAAAGSLAVMLLDRKKS
jgi:hypothetical protein